MRKTQAKAWADWSRNGWANRAAVEGPHIVAKHDQWASHVKHLALQLNGEEGKFDLLAGVLLAAQFLEHGSPYSEQSRRRLKLMMLTFGGLLAESITANDVGGSGDLLGAGEAYESGYAPAGIYSCNSRGEVWRPTGFGSTPPSERRHLRGQSQVLDAAVSRVLRIRPHGARFRIVGRQLFLIATDESV